MTECVESATEVRVGFIEKSASAPSTPTETTKVPHNRTNYFQHRKGRRVCFPNDELIVTGYFDAPDPWSQVNEPTTDGLLSAYDLACKKQHIKPFQIIVQQLQEITNFDKRHEELSFRGLKLDHRHCESLEEIFKRIQFEKLSFEACNLDDEGAAALFDMIEYYESAKQLSISFNKHIDTRGWQACSRMLKKTPCIENFDCSNTPLNEQSLLILGRALRLGGPSLRTLHLENCGICGRSLVVLVAAIKLNSTLKELYLADNKISCSDGIQIGNLLRNNSWLQTLDLRSNNLQDSGAIQIFEGLCEQMEKGLESLILCNNRITHSAMPALGRCLPLKRLIQIDIGHNSITDDGIHELKQGLISSPLLSHLGLQNAKITCEGAVALAEYIADSKCVSCLSLFGNKIRVAGLLALVQSMKHNKTVVRIEIDSTLNCEPEEERVMLLAELEEYCQRNMLAKEQADKERPASDPIPICLNTTKNIASFESYFEAKRSTAPSMEMKDSPKNRFQVSRVFLEKESDGKFLSSSAPSDMTSIQTSLDNLKSSFLPLNGVAKSFESVIEQPSLEGNSSSILKEDDFSRISRKNSKKLAFKLPADALDLNRKVKDRRMSTPAIPLASRLLCRPANPMKLCKHLESLDLRSSVPLSPTRLMQGWMFPMPSMESKEDIFCKEKEVMELS